MQVEIGRARDLNRRSASAETGPDPERARRERNVLQRGKTQSAPPLSAECASSTPQTCFSL